MHYLSAASAGMVIGVPSAGASVGPGTALSTATPRPASGDVLAGSRVRGTNHDCHGDSNSEDSAKGSVERRGAAVEIMISSPCSGRASDSDTGAPTAWMMDEPRPAAHHSISGKENAFIMFRARTLTQRHPCQPSRWPLTAPDDAPAMTGTRRLGPRRSNPGTGPARRRWRRRDLRVG